MSHCRISVVRVPTGGKTSGLVSNVIKETVSDFIPIKTVGYDASRRVTNLGTLFGDLQQRTNNQINVIHAGVEVF